MKKYLRLCWLIAPISIVVYLIWIKHCISWSPLNFLAIFLFVSVFSIVTFIFYAFNHKKNHDLPKQKIMITPIFILSLLLIIGLLIDWGFLHTTTPILSVIFILMTCMVFFLDRILINFISLKYLWIIELILLLSGIIGWNI